MATESPIRISEAGGKWPSHMEVSAFGTPPRNTGTEDLGILLKGHRFRASAKDVAPNRSGSAPPSMEGSFLAIENLLPLQNTQDASLTTLSRAVKNYESEEQLRADPAYLAYYSSNVNLNPRLPPPLTSWENRHIGHHIGSSRNNWGLPSADHRSKTSSHLPQATLSTHKEESEDDSPQQQAHENESVNTRGVWRRQDAASSASQQKNVVDLIQVIILISTSEFGEFISLFCTNIHIQLLFILLLLDSVFVTFGCLLYWVVSDNYGIFFFSCCKLLHT